MFWLKFQLKDDPIIYTKVPVQPGRHHSWLQPPILWQPSYDVQFDQWWRGDWGNASFSLQLTDFTLSLAKVTECSLRMALKWKKGSLSEKTIGKKWKFKIMAWFTKISAVRCNANTYCLPATQNIFSKGPSWVYLTREYSVSCWPLSLLLASEL